MFNPSEDIKQKVKILPPPEGLENFSFGFQDTAADILWLDFIQNAYTCSKYEDPNQEKCPYRWGYRILDAAVKLAPRFEVLYTHGAVQLTVLLDDHLGAKDLFEIGLKIYPNSWLINYRAAFVYLEELKDPKRAAELMERAGKTGAPYWTRSLASRLYDKAGQLELSYINLLELYNEADKGPWKKDLRKRLEAIELKIKNLQKN